jgi:hypothetical protein
MRVLGVGLSRRRASVLAVAYRLVDLATDSGSTPKLLPVQQKSSPESIRGKTLQMKLAEKLRELAK